MKLDKVSVNETLNKAELLLKEEQGLSPAFRAIIEILILLIRTFVSRLSVDSSNSSQIKNDNVVVIKRKAIKNQADKMVMKVPD